MRNSVSINLRKDEIIIKLSEDAEQREIVGRLRKKLPELKKLYQDEKTPIKVVGKVLKNKEIDEIQNLIKSTIDVEINFKTVARFHLRSSNNGAWLGLGWFDWHKSGRSQRQKGNKQAIVSARTIWCCANKNCEHSKRNQQRWRTTAQTSIHKCYRR